MKITKKLLTYVLIIAVILASTASLASANQTLGDLPPNIVTQEMNELTARAAVNAYFAERFTFLSGDSESIPSAVSPITNDELLHRNALIDGNISYISFTLDFLEINCWDYFTEIIVEETVIYIENLMQKNSTISHEIHLCFGDTGSTVISSDAYLDSMVNFESASYLNPKSGSVDPTIVSSSNLCLLHIASCQVGYVEEAENTTKYGNMFNMVAEWCAMFVSWCAEEANISTDVLARRTSPGMFRIDMINENQYHLSQAQNGSYVPVAGDLVFMLNSPTNPWHIGLVVSVSGNIVRIIDGNWGKAVCDRTYELSHTDIVAYGHPIYDMYNHTGNFWHSNSTRHYKICSNCSCAFSHAAHIYNHQTPQSPYVCRICGYTSNNIDLEV